MSVATPVFSASPDDRQYLQLILRVWEAVNNELELRDVLAALAEVLLPFVPMTSIGVVEFNGSQHDLLEGYVCGFPSRKGENIQEYTSRVHQSASVSLPSVPIKPVSPYIERNDYEEPYTVSDLLEKDAWFPHEFNLASFGVRSYASIPLRMKGKTVGTIVFSRLDPLPFTVDQIVLLRDASRPIATAVGNARAFEEIRALRDQLQAENLQLRARVNQTAWFDEIVGHSSQIMLLRDAIEQVGPTNTTVMITGETGTGKELVARALHRCSPRSRGPMIRVNCGAIPETLIASELFGHERGAFTGATERRKGRFEQAHGGTIFLDEVGELPLDTQVMLLRVLQEREFERLGGSQTIHVDVRVIVATNRELQQEVRAGRFRNDLFYRLNIFPIHIPPLRERKMDIPLLASHFARVHGERMGRTIDKIEQRSMVLLESYSWPGNVRELENVIERAAILSRGQTLRINRDMLPGIGENTDVRQQLQGEERLTIENALLASGGRISGPNGAAKRLNLAPSSLEFRIKRLGIDKLQYRPRG